MAITRGESLVYVRVSMSIRHIEYTFYLFTPLMFMKYISTIIVFSAVVFTAAWMMPYNQSVEASSGLPSEVIDVMTRAIEDEYLAEATYAAVLEKHGDVRPFSNIIIAEQRHSSLVADLFEKYNLPVPVNTLIGTITAPDTLLASCELGVEAEVLNIALYDDLLPLVADYPDVAEVLDYLQRASEQNHLPAFERCVDRDGSAGGRGGMGGRGGGGGGRGWRW